MQQNGYFSLKKMETFFSEDKLSLSLLGSTDLSPDALWSNLKDKVMSATVNNNWKANFNLLPWT